MPVANTIGEIGRGFQQQMVQFQAERLTTFYKQVGSIELALSRTKAYLRERQVFGQPAPGQSAPAVRAGRAGGRATTCSSTTPARRRTRCSAARTPPAIATIGKLPGSRLQREVADWAVQFHGGIGYMAENWTSRYFRDTRLDSIGAGADEVMLRILARMDGYSVESRAVAAVVLGGPCRGHGRSDPWYLWSLRRPPPSIRTP